MGNIVIVAPEQLPVPPVVGGSVETCIDALSRKLADRGHQVTVVSRIHPSLPRSGKEMGVRHMRVPGGSRARYLRGVVRAIKRMIGSVNVIQIDNRPTFVRAMRSMFPGKRIVLSLHSRTFMFQLSRRAGDAVLAKTSAVITVGQELKRTLARRHPRYKSRLHAVHPGIDTTRFRPLTERRRKELRHVYGVDGTKNVLFVGRTIPKKGLHTLVEAVARVKDAGRIRLVVAGASWPGFRRQTLYMRKVKQLAKKLGVSIMFTGYVPHAKMHRIYQLADVFVCPTRYQEGFGLVNAEAMASGVPVIASRRGGITEVVRHGVNGVLVSSYKSPIAFANAIARVLRNESLAKRLAKAGRNTVHRKFTWSRTASAFENVYRG